MIPRSGPRTTRVLVIDGDVLVREGITAVLRGEDDLLVVAQAATPATSIDQTSRHKPDIAVIDADLVIGRDIDLCDQIKAVSPKTQCILHSATALTTDDTRGEDAVVLKQLLGDGLADTIRHIASPHD